MIYTVFHKEAIEMIRDDIEKEILDLEKDNNRVPTGKEESYGSPIDPERYLDINICLLKGLKRSMHICNQRLGHIKDKDKVEINRCGCCKGELTDMTFCSRCTDYALHMANKWEEKQ